MSVSRIVLVSLVVLVVVSGARSAQAQAPSLKEALDGIDPVILLTQGKEASGKPGLHVTRDKFVHLFATPESKATFEKAPEKYEIQLSGACARMGGGVTGNPSDYAVVDGKRSWQSTSGGSRRTSVPVLVPPFFASPRGMDRRLRALRRKMLRRFTWRYL